MKRTINKNVIITVFVCGLGFLFGALQNVSAQFIPPGSYQKTCIEIKLDGANLKASCAEKSKSGGIGGSEFSAPVNTALENVYECDGDISNDNGNLKCNRNRNSLLNKQAQTVNS